MRLGIKREMLEYFKNISSPTPQENRFILYLQTEVELFDIIGLSRDDIYDKGYDAGDMSDSQMEDLAEQLAICYSTYFEHDFDILLDEMNISKLNNETID